MSDSDTSWIPSIEALKTTLTDSDRNRVETLRLSLHSLAGLRNEAELQADQILQWSLKSNEDVTKALQAWDLVRQKRSWVEGVGVLAQSYIYCASPEGTHSRRVAEFLNKPAWVANENIQRFRDAEDNLTAFITMAARERNILSPGSQLTDDALRQLRVAVASGNPPPQETAPANLADSCDAKSVLIDALASLLVPVVQPDLDNVANAVQEKSIEREMGQSGRWVAAANRVAADLDTSGEHAMANWLVNVEARRLIHNERSLELAMRRPEYRQAIVEGVREAYSEWNKSNRSTRKRDPNAAKGAVESIPESLMQAVFRHKIHERYQAWVAASAGNSMNLEPAKPIIEPSMLKKPKRSTERGEGQSKLIAALTKHHKYADGSCLNLDPVGNNDLAEQAGVSISTASEFFSKHFGSWGKYRAMCCNNPTALAGKLAILSGDAQRKGLAHFGRKPPNEGERDDEE